MTDSSTLTSTTLADIPKSEGTMPDTTEQLPAGPWRPDPLALLTSATILLCHLPLVSRHLMNLWRFRPEYEFVPFAILVCIGLMIARWPRSRTQQSKTSRFSGISITGCGGLLLFSAVVINSPWLGTAAAIVSTGGLILYYGGWTAARSLASAWILLWMAIPLPGSLHSDLIRILQAVTAHCASAFLELVGLAHVLQGFVFVLPDRELFVAEACSGIHSQFVLVAAAALLTVIGRRHLTHACLLLTGAALLSAIMNTCRVITVVVAAVWLDYDLSTGWPHQLVGYAMVLIGFGLLLSADRLLLGLLTPITTEYRLLGIRGTGTMSRCWNTFFASPQPLRAGVTDDLPVADSAQTAPAGSRRRSLLMFFTAGLFLTAGLLQLATFRRAATADDRSGSLDIAVAENWLPKTLGGWEQVSYESHERDRHSDNGQYGNSWRYRTGRVELAVSIDYPFLGWHELTECYTSIGWKETSRCVESAPDAAGRAADFVVVQLSKPTGERAVLMFSLFDGLRQPVSPLTSSWKSVQLRLEKSPLWSIFGKRTETLNDSLVSVQIQQFVPIDDEDAPHRRQLLRQSFVEFRNRLHNQWTHQSAGSVAGPAPSSTRLATVSMRHQTIQP